MKAPQISWLAVAPATRLFIQGPTAVVLNALISGTSAVVALAISLTVPWVFCSRKRGPGIQNLLQISLVTGTARLRLHMRGYSAGNILVVHHSTAVLRAALIFISIVSSLTIECMLASLLGKGWSFREGKDWSFREGKGRSFGEGQGQSFREGKGRSFKEGTKLWEREGSKFSTRELFIVFHLSIVQLGCWFCRGAIESIPFFRRGVGRLTVPNLESFRNSGGRTMGPWRERMYVMSLLLNIFISWRLGCLQIQCTLCSCLPAWVEPHNWKYMKCWYCTHYI